MLVEDKVELVIQLQVILLLLPQMEQQIPVGEVEVRVMVLTNLVVKVATVVPESSSSHILHKYSKNRKWA
jgi:hypothetical protein